MAHWEATPKDTHVCESCAKLLLCTPRPDVLDLESQVTLAFLTTATETIILTQLGGLAAYRFHCLLLYWSDIPPDLQPGGTTAYLTNSVSAQEATGSGSAGGFTRLSMKLFLWAAIGKRDDGVPHLRRRWMPRALIMPNDCHLCCMHISIYHISQSSGCEGTPFFTASLYLPKLCTTCELPRFFCAEWKAVKSVFLQTVCDNASGPCIRWNPSLRRVQRHAFFSTGLVQRVRWEGLTRTSIFEICMSMH